MNAQEARTDGGDDKARWHCKDSLLGRLNIFRQGKDLL